VLCWGAVGRCKGEGVEVDCVRPICPGDYRYAICEVDYLVTGGLLGGRFCEIKIEVNRSILVISFTRHEVRRAIF